MSYMSLHTSVKAMSAWLSSESTDPNDTRQVPLSPDRFTVLRAGGLCCRACVKVTLRYASTHNKTELTLSHGHTWIAQYNIELQSTMSQHNVPHLPHLCFKPNLKLFCGKKTNNLPCVWWEGCVKGQLQSLCNLKMQSTALLFMLEGLHHDSSPFRD